MTSKEFDPTKKSSRILGDRDDYPTARFIQEGRLYDHSKKYVGDHPNSGVPEEPTPVEVQPKQDVPPPPKDDPIKDQLAAAKKAAKK